MKATAVLLSGLALCTALCTKNVNGVPSHPKKHHEKNEKKKHTSDDEGQSGPVAPVAPVAPIAPVPSPSDSYGSESPTLYLCGDSTMAPGGAHDGSTDGWGQYIGKYVTIKVVNKAMGGRSVRTYTEEGHFAELLELVRPKSILLCQFGHNDNQSNMQKNDNGRADCPGDGPESCKTGSNGMEVHTYPWYLEQAARNFTAKGVSFIISSQTPNNLWESGTFSDTPASTVALAKLAASRSPGTTFVDHWQAVANMYRKLGPDAVKAFYPKDHTHTSPSGADAVAQAFAQAVAEGLSGTTPLQPFIKQPYPAVY